MRVILASKSVIRKKILENAGIKFEIKTMNIDERALENKLSDETSSAPPPQSIAKLLSYEKARAVAEANVDAVVIGADQVLAFNHEILHKAKNLAEAKDQLKKLRGQTHHLYSGVCIIKNQTTWLSYVERSTMRMRNFSDKFLEDYLQQNQQTALTTVGGYAIEEKGIQLFEKIEGDMFSIQGLPLLPILQALRDNGAIHS